MQLHIHLVIEASPGEIAVAVDSLARISLYQMGVHRLPPLYGGTIRYKRERPGNEDWQTASLTARLGTGDCEDLAAYRIAELWHWARMMRPGGDAGARCVVKVVRSTLYHIQVRHSDGQIEDPSAVLGMRGKA